MNLVIFDIDGTLTDTGQVDSDCFEQIFFDVFSIQLNDTDWSTFTHYSDSGISAEIIENHFGRPIQEAEMAKLETHFLSLLETAFKSGPERFREVSGAADILRHIRAQPDWAVAIATGCWSTSALLKLRLAGISMKGLPLATCDNNPAREEIVMSAIAQAQEKYGRRRFERMVCVGDGIWDIKTSKNLGLALIGIYSAPDKSHLQDAGIEDIFRDFSERDKFMAALRQARVPA